MEKKANLPYPGQKVFAGNASQNNYNLVTQKGKTELRIPLFPMFRNSPDLFFDILAFQHFGALAFVCIFVFWYLLHFSIVDICAF